MPLASLDWRFVLILAVGFVLYCLVTVVPVLNDLYPEWFADLRWYLQQALDQLAHRRERSRRQRDQCSKCGYNLRGNLTGICPECGAEIDFLPARIWQKRR